MLIRSVIKNKFRNNAYTPTVRFLQELFEVRKSSIVRMYNTMFDYIKTIVLERRRKKRQQPDCVDSQVFEVIKFLNEPLKVPYTVTIAVEKSTHRNLIDDCI